MDFAKSPNMKKNEKNVQNPLDTFNAFHITKKRFLEDKGKAFLFKVINAKNVE
jgi:hypothetical protein